MLVLKCSPVAFALAEKLTLESIFSVTELLFIPLVPCIEYVTLNKSTAVQSLHVVFNDASPLIVPLAAGVTNVGDIAKALLTDNRNAKITNTENNMFLFISSSPQKYFD